MAFLILTDAGLQALLTAAPRRSARVYLNPIVASPAALEQLDAAGMIVHLLPRPVDPRDDAAVAAALQEAEQGGGTVWLERGQAGVAPAPAPALPAAPSLKSRLGVIAASALHFAGRTLGTRPHLMIIPYRGFGNATMVSVRGRVLHETGFKSHSLQDTAWQNVAALYRRIESDQVPGARVRARFQGIQADAITDRGGYFTMDIALPAPLPESGWHTVDVALVDTAVRASAEVVIPPATARFGIISDIDDTLLWTNVTNKLNMA